MGQNADSVGKCLVFNSEVSTEQRYTQTNIANNIYIGIKPFQKTEIITHFNVYKLLDCYGFVQVIGSNDFIHTIENDAVY